MLLPVHRGLRRHGGEFWKELGVSDKWSITGYNCSLIMIYKDNEENKCRPGQDYLAQF
jgi:hypothetical protein